MLQAARSFLGAQVDNSPLILFRIFFGLLIAAESIGAIFTGWVRETFIDPEFTFTVIGFEWLQPLEGHGMIYYFLVMGIAGIFISLGLFYRASTFVFLSMWTVAYLMQKSHYNNHYYLLILLCAAMLLMPAHKAKSLDARFGLTVPSMTCLRLCHYFFVFQVLIVYVFASLHKMNGDWIVGKPLDIWFQRKADFWLIGPLLAEEWFPLLIAWGGILYDGSIVFLLLYKKTRKLGFILSIIFNLFNSAVFHIGIFPYLMIAFSVFFFSPETIRKIFFPKRRKPHIVRAKLSLGWTWVVIVYFSIQLLLPLRHHLYQGPVSWTEEGHRLSWRMMLRTKYGSMRVITKDLATGDTERVNLKEHLIRNQITSMKGQPDMMWQFAQYLRKKRETQGRNVAVFFETNISLNGRARKKLIDPSVNLAAQPWERFKHADWILTYEGND